MVPLTYESTGPSQNRGKRNLDRSKREIRKDKKMKKLMFGIAALVAGSVMAIESANVVGYATTDLNDAGFKGIGLNFVNVSGAATTLGDLKVTGYKGDFEGEVCAQILDEYGFIAENEGVSCSYVWADFEEEGVRYTGWYDDNGELADSTELEIGSGIWMFSDSSAWQIQCAGQVYNQALPIKLIGGGFRLCANPVPAAITYGQILVDGYEGDFEGEVCAQVLDENGFVAEVEGVSCAYIWADFEEEGVRYTGWYDDNGELVENATLGIGEAIWVLSDSDEYSIVFPTVL